MRLTFAIIIASAILTFTIATSLSPPLIMNGPEAPRATVTLVPAHVNRQWPELITSLLAQPAVSSLVQGAGEGLSSIFNRPDVNSVGNSIISVITAGAQETQSTQATSTAAPESSVNPPSGTPSLSPTPSTAQAASGGSKPNVAAIAGGVVGGVLGLAIIAALLFLCLWCRRRRRKEPKRDHALLFENEGFVGAEGTPGLVDPYARSSLSSPVTSSFASARNRPSLTSGSSHDVYHTPSPITKGQPQMPIVPAPPLTNSHASIPTIATGAGTFGPRRSTDSEFGVHRTSSTASRPLPAVPLSRNATLSRSQNDLHRAALQRSHTDLHRHSTLSHSDVHVPMDPGYRHLTPYPEESPMGERPPHMVEHAVDAGSLGRKEVLPPMYNPTWYEQR
ncbi:hypothetical protein CC85DRAFT_329487 [Cutaneotrichosporon oleaginosum]|uniref:Mid2 domain-containing protein n=1 Tax=Cutaneotrichosporon oleaginosum TaxID=879819 RepID=A0A0J1B011_9TREE|nr:uncharacterized protein CC85DRAFT_329487 [Cutaneotrichosporon oleaginosum]KLT40924.1 hypothetical protein CC85DRAFT_329487 [Cutaneotrichosporon oleaginosum]TXT15417.1 hypothetical protein COLE_01610 [Cutaneotrichosporon oleaginosum]